MPTLGITDARVFVDRENPWGLERVHYGMWREYFKVSGYIRECDNCGSLWLGPEVMRRETREHRGCRDGLVHHWCTVRCEHEWAENVVGHWNKAWFKFPKVREAGPGQYIMTQGGV